MRAQAQDYIRACHDPEDRLAVVLIQREGEQAGKVEQRFWSAAQAASPRIQRWLRYRNAHGADVFASANPIKPGVRRRTAASIREARWLYVDIDERGEETLSRIDADADSGRLPGPTAVIRTSRGRYQALWRIEPCDPPRAERSLRALARHYGTDPAATDCARVLRLPGFRSHKRGEEVRLQRFVRQPPAAIADFERSLPATARDRRPQPRASRRGRGRPAGAGGDRSPSGRDWAWTRGQLRRGRPPTAVVAALAARRPDKSNPGDYAARTVFNALRSLEREAGPCR